MGEPQKPFACLLPECGMRFTNEDHLHVHTKKHDMVLQLGLEQKTAFVADQTPTPTRFIRNCEEVGLFQDLQHVAENPFDEGFKKAMEAKHSNYTLTLESVQAVDGDELHTPQMLFPLADGDQAADWKIVRSSEVTNKAEGSKTVTLKINNKDVLLIENKLSQPENPPLISQKSLDYVVDSLTGESDKPQFRKPNAKGRKLTIVKRNRSQKNVLINIAPKKLEAKADDISNDFEVLVKLPGGKQLRMKAVEELTSSADTKKLLRQTLIDKEKGQSKDAKINAEKITNNSKNTSQTSNSKPYGIKVSNNVASSTNLSNNALANLNVTNNVPNLVTVTNNVSNLIDLTNDSHSSVASLVKVTNNVANTTNITNHVPNIVNLTNIPIINVSNNVINTNLTTSLSNSLQVPVATLLNATNSTITANKKGVLQVPFNNVATIKNSTPNPRILQPGTLIPITIINQTGDPIPTDKLNEILPKTAGVTFTQLQNIKQNKHAPNTTPITGKGTKNGTDTQELTKTITVISNPFTNVNAPLKVCNANQLAQKETTEDKVVSMNDEEREAVSVDNESGDCIMQEVTNRPEKAKKNELETKRELESRSAASKRYRKRLKDSMHKKGEENKQLRLANQRLIAEKAVLKLMIAEHMKCCPNPDALRILQEKLMGEIRIVFTDKS